MTTNKIETDPLEHLDDEEPLLDRARSAIPGHAVTKTALGDLDARLRQARALPGHEIDTVIAPLVADILTGAPIPDDLADQVLARRRANEHALAHAQALGALQVQLRAHLTTLQAEGADHALAFLADQLRALLGEARPILAELGDVDTAEDAITTDRVPAWQQAARLAGRYRGLRSTQLVIVAAALYPDRRSTAGREVRGLVDDVGHLRHPDRHGTLGLRDDQRPDTAAHSVTTSRNGATVTTNHARPLDAVPWVSGVSDLADLRYMLRPDVEAWVPSLVELTTARDDITRRKHEQARALAEPARSRLNQIGGPAPLRSSS